MEARRSLQPQLTRPRILTAAVRLVDREGLDALTMRKLAAELRVAPMSIYNHVPGKAALLNGVVRTVLAEIELPAAPDTAEWGETLRGILRAFRSVARRHPHVVPLLTRRPAPTPEALRPVEAGFEALRRAGFDEETAAHVFRLVTGYVIGYVSLELGGFFDVVDRDAPVDLQVLAPFPRVMEAVEHLLEWDPDAEFDIGLELILAGVRSRLQGGEG